ncbi:prolyl endopeptidase-like protein [Rozella allomycis CSF55]|uniref:Prolyl endopeptidase n=1 Tax=Rozella allomycis (strain CSF55) TaxID=988480 RepID=A0A4P9YQ05_ROZAC|nr:prolyl endopeptidase-like protein [Rozella allomycis CSF55]
MSSFNFPFVTRDINSKYLCCGRSISDPYSWLENPDSDETRAFVSSQNELFFEYINDDPLRSKLKDRFKKFFNYEKTEAPFKSGEFYYYFYNDGTFNHSTISDPGEVFFDPNELAVDGSASLNTYSFSESGKYFAFGVSCNGSDWVTIQIQDVEKKKLPDRIEWVKFSSISWVHNDDGFFYTRYPQIKQIDKGTETNLNKFPKLYYHKLATCQKDDILIFEYSDEPYWRPSATVSDDGKYLIISTSRSTENANKLFVQQLDICDFSKHKIIKLFDDFEASYEYITNEDNIFYLKTNSNALKEKLIKIDINNTSLVDVVIPEAADVLESCYCVAKNKLICVYMKDVKNVIDVFDLSGTHLTCIPLDIGSVAYIKGRKKDTVVFFKFYSFNTPGLVYEYDLSDLTTTPTIWRQDEIVGFEPSKFVIEQVFYESKDSQRIPMFIFNKRSIPRNGQTPCLLYGYGGFNISLTPFFSSSMAAAADELNMTIAIANLRGGGEYGEEWHKAGILNKKQNVFDDFQWAAKYLVANNYTCPSLLAINGGSNGGLLVAACVNQAPELFGCAIAEVGVLDMLKFHKFTIGHAWMDEYGNPDFVEHFECLSKYSPVHNVDSSKQYPPVLVMTSDHDDRVVPLHSYKWISELQYNLPKNDHPLLIRIETKAGHGSGKSLEKRIEEAVDKYLFIAKSMLKNKI